MELSPQQDVYYIDTVSPIDYFIDTVTPSAIQLNKEKTMSIELDGPLYLGSNSLQQQVDQNTEDITELQSDVSSIEGDIGSLDNLATSDKSSLVNAINETLSVLDPTQTADYIKNSKGLESGEVSSNASIYPWVEELSHSTFDLAKFTVVGSPIVTSDGIASGFSIGNYVYGVLNLTSAKEFVLESELILGQITTAQILGEIYNNNTGFPRISIESSTQIRLTAGTNTYINLTIPTLTSGQKIKIRATITTTKLKLDVWINNTLYTGSADVTYTFSTLDCVYIGSNRVGNFPVTGSIDLKQFSITVDGVEVFSGNKTGIDTVKPDDYTVVGTPTISDDGIITNGEWTEGSAPTGCIQAEISNISSSQDFEIIVPYTCTTATIANTEYLAAVKRNGSENSRISIWRNTSNVIVFRFFNNNNSWKSEGFANLTLTVGTSYLIKMKVKDGVMTGYFSVDNGKTWTDSGFSASGCIQSSDTSDTMYFGAVSNEMDLNLIKVNISSNLVYQPCLKIPYTESKTGSKIVDVIYRDRVNDMYEQFGYAPYYTLDTENENYTIPKGELYGMVNKLVPTLVAPDYSKPVSLTYSSGLAIENDGWLEVQIQSSEATANPYVSINGSIICRTSVNSNGDLNRDTAMMVVRKGDVITSGGYSADTTIVLTYYPFKV